MNNNRSQPWQWVPSLYFTEGIPYFIVNSVALLMYKRCGLNDGECALYASWLSLPWVIKPLWSPIVEILKSKQWWIVVMEMTMAIALAGVAFTLPTPYYVQLTMAFFFLIAFSSATHDIAADGFYMEALDERQQAMNVGVRSIFDRLSKVISEGLLIMFIGSLEVYTRSAFTAWSLGLGAVALLLALATLYHWVVLPKRTISSENTGTFVRNKSVFDEKQPTFVDGTEREQTVRGAMKEFADTFVSFFKKPGILMAITFLLLYRLPEAILTKIYPLFLTEKVSLGGLGLSTSEYGLAYGTLGVIGLLLGGILGGIVVAMDGFRKWRWPMVMAISLPNCVYIFLAYFQPENIWWISSAIAIEQFGYGFGFTLYMLFMLYFSQGKSKAAHYSLCTGFMALGLLLPGQVAGYVATWFGYYGSFILVMLLVPITFVVTSLIRVPDDFGRRAA